MPQNFVKGYTNNHLTWLMVDATDFATPESALSAATKIKIYGKLKSATGVNFVSSGTGSLTNDIQHVGPSVLGIYTIALAKADLSDASAAWYDQYIISLSATGAAYQTIVVDGGIMQSYLSDLLSDIGSDVIVMSGILSDTYSALLLVQSLASDAHSAAVLAQALSASDLSDIRSAIAAGPAATVTASDISDIASAVRAGMVSDLSDILSAAAQTNSRVLLIQSRLSDLDSRLVSDISDILSSVRGTSDYLSKMSDVLSNAYSAAAVGASRALLAQSYASDAYSAAIIIQSRLSDFDSRMVSDISDVRSAIAAITATVSASDISDIASAVLVAIQGAVASASDVASKVWAEKYTAASNVKASTFGSALRLNMSRISDAQSYLVAMSDVLSNAYSAAAVGSSRALLIQSRLSDFDSRMVSDVSDIRSAIAAITVSITASDISDIASAVAAAVGFTPSAIAAKTISDMESKMGATLSQQYSVVLRAASHASDAHSAALLAASAASDAHSAALLIQSMVSDVDSALTSQAALNASSLSDIYSATLLAQSLASDAHSAAVLAASHASDVYSMLSANRTEPAQGSPGVSITVLQKVDYLYKAWRNRTTQTATEYALYADDGTTKDHEAAVSDNGTTFERGEVTTGA